MELGALIVLAALFAWREHFSLKERREWAQERSGLLNRIKPETAQYPEPQRVTVPEAEEETVYLDENDEPYFDPRTMNGGS